MKKYLFLPLFLLLIACGGSDDSGLDFSGDGEPSILNLSFTPNTISQGEGGGAIELTITFDFIDEDKNLDTIVLYDPIEDVALTLDMDQEGQQTGTYFLIVVIDTNALEPGTYPFELYVSDSDDNHSNTLTGSLTVQ